MMQNAYTAVVTPMKNGKTDMKSFEDLISFQSENGIQGIVVNGTTGESPTTNDNEKMAMVKCTMENSKTDIISGCGTNDTAHSEHLIQKSIRLGVNRILLVDCYYNGPSSMELAREYYGYLCAKFPEQKFIAYVIPGRTGCELSVEELVWLHNTYPNLDTVKEATGNLDRMQKTRAISKSICIMSGDDDLTYNIMKNPQIGGNGVISVMSNIAPKATQDFCKAVLEKNPKVEQMANELQLLFSLVTVKTPGQKFRNPVPIKTVMAGLGMINYQARRPLGKMSKEATLQIRNAVRQMWQNNPYILEPIEKFYDVDINKRLEDDQYWVSY